MYFCIKLIFLSIVDKKLTIFRCSSKEGNLTSNFAKLFLEIPKTETPFAIILIFFLKDLFKNKYPLKPNAILLFLSLAKRVCSSETIFPSTFINSNS